jgi:hypothetical protein
VPNWIRFIRMMPMGSPFISWTYLMSGLMMDKLSTSAVLRRSADEFDDNGEPKELRVPHALLMMPVTAAFLAMSMIFRGDDFEDEDQKYLQVGLPKYTDGGKGLAFVGLDADGRPMFFDYGKYFAAMTPARIAGLFDNLQESDNRPVGIGGVMKELGFGSDPFSQLFQIWVQQKDPNSGMPIAKKGSTFFEGVGAQAAATADLMLPPIFGGFSDGSNAIFGDYGVAASMASRDSATIGYEQDRPALTAGQKLARLMGVGVFVTDPLPMLDKQVKDATRLRASVQGEMSKIMKDEALSPEARDSKLVKMDERYQRLKAREEELKTMQAEMAPFYARLREAAIAKSGIDPAVTNAETMRERRQKNSQEDVEEAVAVARSVQDARN